MNLASERETPATNNRLSPSVMLSFDQSIMHEKHGFAKYRIGKFDVLRTNPAQPADQTVRVHEPPVNPFPSRDGRSPARFSPETNTSVRNAYRTPI
jgi:hypothetical protein